jgi:predicted nuclease of predicted toxin-antitoxin system
MYLMKLLFDQNLSPNLAKYFKRSFNTPQHLQDFGFEALDDLIVWDFAQKNVFTISTKDSDFNNLVSLLGFPPKIIWIRRGNCSAKNIPGIINENLCTIKAFINDLDNDILSIF